MDITDTISQQFVELSPETPVSKLAGTFEDSSLKGAIVYGDEYEGVVTRRQLVTSHHPPEEKLRSLVWHVPRLTPDEDIRNVARLMVESDAHLLPVFQNQELMGVVTSDDILEAVESFLDVATVGEVCTRELITTTPEATFGQALNTFRENRITHLPVVEDGSAVGIVTLYDLTDLTVRAMNQSQAGDVDAVDSHSGSFSRSAGRSRGGGFGSREGEIARMLELPVRDLMVSPVRTISPEETVDTAVEKMFEIDGSSLVVTEEDRPTGIVTKTDILESLTWEAGGNRAVQVYGIDLLDTIDYDDIIAMIDELEHRNQEMSVHDARIHLQKHEERLRGVPLVLARVRLHTDRGLYLGTGEGYGAGHAIREVNDVLKRRIQDDKQYGKSKKPPDESFWEKRFGWSLEES